MIMERPRHEVELYFYKYFSLKLINNTEIKAQVALERIINLAPDQRKNLIKVILSEIK
jgi:hypothetical protein